MYKIESALSNEGALSHILYVYNFIRLNPMADRKYLSDACLQPNFRGFPQYPLVLVIHILEQHLSVHTAQNDIRNPNPQYPMLMMPIEMVTVHRLQRQYEVNYPFGF